MRIRSIIVASVALCSFFLVACGVDTTGLNAASSRVPRGNLSSTVTVVEFGDFQCPVCKTAHELITKPMLQKYGEKIRFEFMQFPLVNIHQNALEAAEASECAADQGKFWEFFDLAYEKQESLSSSALRDWGKVLGLNADLFDRCISSGIKEKTVMTDEAQGEKVGIEGTPTYFVNGVRIPENSVAAMNAAIDAALKTAQNIPL